MGLTCRSLPKNVVHHFPASTLAIASSVLRSRAGRRPKTAGLMVFSETPFRIIGAVFFVFPMVVFGLRTILLAINPRNPLVAVVWGRSESLSRNGTLAEFCGGGAVGRPALPAPR